MMIMSSDDWQDFTINKTLVSVGAGRTCVQFDDVTYVYDDVTYVYDDVTYSCLGWCRKDLCAV
jgi:hypothetical protein